MERAPGGSGAAMWAVAVTMALATLAGLEWFWRSHGYRPGVNDDKPLWADHRARVYERGGNTVVLVGQSRLLLGFSTEVFRARFPDKPLVNLAVSGLPCMATLRDLTSDERFRGTVLCSVVPFTFARAVRDHQQPYVDTRHDHSWMPRLEGAYWLRAHLACMQPQLCMPRILINKVLRQPLPAPPFIVTRPDRSWHADFELTDVDRRLRYRLDRMRRGWQARKNLSPDEWREEVTDIIPWLRRLEARGGRVVFVRMPTSGEAWQMSEKYYPRSAYWDQLEAITESPTLHFRDDPGLSGFVCPDASHLDYRQATEFTSQLLDVLVERGLLSDDRVPTAPGR